MLLCLYSRFILRRRQNLLRAYFDRHLQLMIFQVYVDFGPGQEKLLFCGTISIKVYFERMKTNVFENALVRMCYLFATFKHDFSKIKFNRVFHRHNI